MPVCATSAISRTFLRHTGKIEILFIAWSADGRNGVSGNRGKIPTDMVEHAPGIATFDVRVLSIQEVPQCKRTIRTNHVTGHVEKGHTSAIWKINAFDPDDDG